MKTERPVDNDHVLYHHRTQGKAVEGVHIRGVIGGMRAKGLSVDVLSLPGADPYAPDRAISPTVQTTALAKLVSALPEPLFEAVEFAYNFIVAWRVWRYLGRRPDTRFIYERYSMYLFATTLIARWMNKPIFIEVNDSAFVERVRPLFFAGLARAVERWVLRRATGLIFVSTRFQDIVAQRCPGMAPAIVSPNAADIDQFSFSASQRASVRERYGFDGAVVCGYLGAFVPWHAIDSFVEKVADRLAEAPRLKLLLVGDGATFAKVAAFVSERGLADRIVLAGRVRHSEVPELLAAMDLAILPSAGSYTSPVKLFEFMACGVAPVAPDLDPICEVLESGRTGWLFPTGDLDAAVDVVIARSAEPDRLREVGDAAREYIRAERQWVNNVEQLLAFSRSLHEERGYAAGEAAISRV
ncbi:MAG: glycosyltransferase [Burkholderiaceae bacterium]